MGDGHVHVLHLNEFFVISSYGDIFFHLCIGLLNGPILVENFSSKMLARDTVLQLTTCNIDSNISKGTDWVH